MSHAHAHTRDVWTNVNVCVYIIYRLPSDEVVTMDLGDLLPSLTTTWNFSLMLTFVSWWTSVRQKVILYKYVHAYACPGSLFIDYDWWHGGPEFRRLSPILHVWQVEKKMNKIEIFTFGFPKLDHGWQDL